MYARITGLVVLASLIALPLLKGQEPPRPTPAQLRFRDASAARTAARQQATLQAPSMPAGPLVTLDILLIDHNSDAGRAAPSAAEFVKMHQAGELDRVVRVQLSNVAENAAYTQLGENVPQATARAARGGFARGDGEAGVTYSYTYQEIGTLVRANTRVEDSGTVLVDLQFERSSVAPYLQPSDESDDLIGRQKTIRRARQSTLRLKPGEPAIAEAWQSTARGETTGQFLVVTAHVQPGGDRPASARDGEARTRIFMLQTAKADAMQRVLVEVYGDSKPIRTSIDATRNAIIVSGPREELEEVEQLIQALDASEK